MAHLEKKYDPTLTTYFEAFYKMCQRVSQKERKDGDTIIVSRIEKSSKLRASTSKWMYECWRRCRRRIAGGAFRAAGGTRGPSLLNTFCSSPLAATVNTVYVEPVSEDRAHKCLGRIDLLIKIRRDILVHSQLEDRLNELTKVKVVESTRDLFIAMKRPSVRPSVDS